jgi:hypothetical protein
VLCMCACLIVCDLGTSTKAVLAKIGLLRHRKRNDFMQFQGIEGIIHVWIGS